MTADKLVALVKLIEAGTISGNAGKKVLPSMFETDETVEAIVDRMGSSRYPTRALSSPSCRTLSPRTKRLLPTSRQARMLPASS